MCNPRYQFLKNDDIPVYQGENFKAKVIAGDVFGVKGPIEAKTPVYYIDFKMNSDSTYKHMIP